MPVGMMMGANRRRSLPVGGGGGAGTAKATPAFDGAQLSAWNLVQVSNPPNLESPNHPAPNGTDVVQLSTDPLGVVPGPVLRFTNNGADHVGDRVRAQVSTPEFMAIDGTKTYWLRRCIGIPADFPLIQGPPNGNYADCSTGGYFGQPYGGTSTMPNGIRNWQGANHFCTGRTASWNTPVWHVPATPGWHKLAVRVHFATNSSGWIELYYAKWGQPLQQQQLVVADSGGTLSLGGLRLNCVTCNNAQNLSPQKMTANQYRNYPQASFGDNSGGRLTHLYQYKIAAIDDVNVPGGNPLAVDPEPQF